MKVKKMSGKKPVKLLIAGGAVILAASVTVGAILFFNKNDKGDPAKKQDPLHDYIASADVNPFIIDTGYKKPEIVLDGKLDDAQWKNKKALEYGDQVSASVKGFYGKDGIYIGMLVADKDLSGSSKNVYDNSSIEVYLDTTGKGGAKPSGSQIQLFIDVNEQIMVRRGSNGLWLDTDLIKNYAVQMNGTLNDKKADTGYSVELFIPYAQLGGEPQNDYGITFGVVGCKEGSRDNWTGVPGANPQVPDTYYKFYRDTNTFEAKRKTNHAEITLDGKDSETQWSGKSSYVFGDGGRGSVKTFFGSKGMYLLFDMKDSAVCAQGLVPHLNDSVEIYLDPLKNGGAKPQKDDIQVRSDVSGNIVLLRGTGTEWVEALNQTFSGTRVNGTLNGSSTGYGMEVFIPWSDMGMTAAPENMKINFGSVDYNGKKDAKGARVIAWSGTGKDVQKPDTYIKINKTGVEGATVTASASEITLDGSLTDTKWNNTPTFSYSGGKVRVRWFWTTQGCYTGFEVKDSSVQTDGSKPFENSSVEMYLDYNKDGGTPKADDRTILVDAAGRMLFRKGVNGQYLDFGTRSILSGVKKTSTGYTVEVYVPWSEFGKTSKPSVMGVAFGQVTRASSAKATVWTPDGLCVDPQKPSNYSEFTPTRIGKEVVAPSVTLDGRANESFWSGKPVFTFGKNGSAKVRQSMDNKGISLFFDVADTDVWAKSSKIWENDGVEIYLDPLKNGGAAPATDDYQIRIDASGQVSCLKGTGKGWADCPNMVQSAVRINGTANDSKADTGFAVEVFIPWSSLGLTAKPASMGINFGAPYNQKGVFGGWTGTGNDPQVPNQYCLLSGNSITK